MIIEISKDELRALVAKQLGNLFVYSEGEDGSALDAGIAEALPRVETCFAETPNYYYRKDGEAYFNPFHSGHYCVFLYFLSHACSRAGAELLADRIYYLNKALNAVDLYHEIELPDIFFIDHPVGSVMGRASYSNYFSFCQNCTVGNSRGVFPVFGEHVSLYSGAMVVGNCQVGDAVIFSAGCYVKDTDIPSGSIVFGRSPDLTIREKGRDYVIDRVRPRKTSK